MYYKKYFLLHSKTTPGTTEPHRTTITMALLLASFPPYQATI
jgi:hypothetical protein